MANAERKRILYPLSPPTLFPNAISRRVGLFIQLLPVVFTASDTLPTD
jgi:hypothetical protein